MPASGGGSLKDFECSGRIVVSDAYMLLRGHWVRLLFGTKSANVETALIPMKLRFPLLLAVVSVAFTGVTPRILEAKSDAEQICVSVGRLLEEGHYTHQQLSADVSQKFLKNYLELLDFSHLFFTQKDVDGLTTKYGTALGDDVLLGNLKPAYEIYDLYQKRVDDRVAKVKELLKQPFDFKTAATVEVR